MQRDKIKAIVRLSPEELTKEHVKTLLALAREWYGEDPMADDADIGNLDEDAMRKLVKENPGKWRPSITRELIKRGYVEVMCHEIDLDDTPGTTVLLMKYLTNVEDAMDGTIEGFYDEFNSDLYDRACEIAGDELFNLNVNDNMILNDNARYRSWFWVKDSIMNTVISRLKEVAGTFVVMRKEDEVYYTRYFCRVDGIKFSMIQTFPRKVAYFVEPMNNANRVKKVLQKAFPEAFEGIPDGTHCIFFTTRDQIENAVVIQGNQYQIPPTRIHVTR